MEESIPFGGVMAKEKSQACDYPVELTDLCPGIEKLHINDLGFYGYSPFGDLATEKSRCGGSSVYPSDPYPCPGIDNLRTHEHGFSGYSIFGDNAMAKSQCGGGDSSVDSTDPCPGIEKPHISDPGFSGFSWSPVDPPGDNPHPGAHLSAIVADEISAEERKAIVWEVVASDADAYDFILVDYVIRALNPLRRMFTDLLNKFDIWPYQIISPIYIEMRSCRRFLIVMISDFAQIFELVEYLFLLQYHCNVLDSPEVPIKIAQLRQMVKAWVDKTES